MEIDSADMTMVKRRKTEVKRRENEEDEMKRVAEIVLVLSAMGKMRAGRDPTVAEKTMMAEARAKVVALCEELAPKDILPTESFDVVIEDLGLNRLKDRVGFRPLKNSISEKIALAKRQMEESKVFAVQPASYPSQKVQTAGENHGTPPTVRVSSDKVGHVPVSVGTFQPPTPVANVSSATSTPIRFNPPTTEVRAPVVSPVALTNTGRDSTSVVPPRLDRAHIRPDGRLNGQSLPHVPVSSAANQHTVRTTPVHLRPQAPIQANVRTNNMLSDQLPMRTDSNVSLSAPQMKSQSAVAQMPGLVASQTAPGALPNMHHPVQGMPFVHTPAVNHHLEVSRLVQKLLTPKLPPRSVWTPPSRDYMNRPLPCQFCKLVISEVENMVICDACEKAFHLGCLQSHNAKSIPRGEWHCPRCVTMSHGKPFPPKYGRVTRNMNIPKVLSITTGVQMPSDRKGGIMDEKANQSNATIDRIQDYKTHFQVNQPNATTNGSQDSKTHSQAVKVAEPSSESFPRHGSDIYRNDISIGVKEDGPKLEKIQNNATESAVSLSTPTEPCDKPIQQVKCEVLPSEDRLISETAPKTAVLSQANDKLGDLSASSNQTDVDQKAVDGAIIPVHQHSDSNGVMGSNQCHHDENDENNSVQKNVVEIERVHNLAGELAEASESDLYNVDWIGDLDRVVDKKNFFRSCRINGMVYEVQDYALLRLKSGKLIPSKLQAMWEDSETNLKWLIVHKCYFPDDLPEEVGRPGAPQNNEVYESTHDSNVLAGFVQGPCEVLPFRKFGEESEGSDQGSLEKETRQPIFIRNWFYDETRRAFCPNAS